MKEIFFITGNKGKKASFQNKFKGSDVIVETADFKFEEPNINDIEYIVRQKFYMLIQDYKNHVLR